MDYISLLPAEIENAIASQLSVTDISSLARTCKHFYETLLSYLYTVDARTSRRALKWAVSNGNFTAARNSVIAYEALGAQHSTSDLTTPNQCNVLHMAVQRGHTAIVSLLLCYNFNPEAVDVYGHTALHYAVKQKANTITELLLDGGSDIDAKNRAGTTPLMYAAEHGRLRTVGHLLSRGADARMVDRAGASVLQRSLAKENIDIVQLLLGHGADPNQEDNLGDSPLRLAARRGQLSVISILIDHGADLQAYGHLALIEAVRCRHAAAVRLLLHHQVDIEKLSGGQTVLHLAARVSNMLTINVLLQSGANLDAVDFHGRTPLWDACDRVDGKEAKVMRLLINWGASFHITDKLGEQVLHKAVQMGRSSIVEDLLLRGVDVGTTSTSGMAGIHLACKEGSLSILKFLLSCGAMADATDANGRTPAHYAMAFGNFEVFHCLRNAGADIGRKDCFGSFPADLCGMGQLIGL